MPLPLHSVAALIALSPMAMIIMHMDSRPMTRAA
jgi:hypothetical protein